MASQSQPGGADAPVQVEELTELQKNDAILQEILDAVGQLPQAVQREFAETIAGVQSRIAAARSAGVDEVDIAEFTDKTNELLRQIGVLQLAVSDKLNAINSAKAALADIGVNAEGALSFSDADIAQLAPFNGEIHGLVRKIGTSIDRVKNFLSVRERQRAAAKQTGYELSKAGVKADHLRAPKLPPFKMSKELTTKYSNLENGKTVLNPTAYNRALGQLDAQRATEEDDWRLKHSVDEKEVALLTPVIEALDKGESLGDLFAKPSFDAEGTYTAIANRIRKPALELDRLDNTLLTRLPRVIIEKIVHGMTAEEFWQSMERHVQDENLPVSHIAVSEDYNSRKMREISDMTHKLQNLSKALETITSPYKSYDNWPADSNSTNEYREALTVFSNLKNSLEYLKEKRPDNVQVKEILGYFADHETVLAEVVSTLVAYNKCNPFNPLTDEVEREMTETKGKIKKLRAAFRGKQFPVINQLQFSVQGVERKMESLTTKYDAQRKKEQAEDQKKRNLTAIVVSIIGEQSKSLQDVEGLAYYLGKAFEDFTNNLVGFTNSLHFYRLANTAFGRPRRKKRFSGIGDRDKIDFSPNEQEAAVEYFKILESKGDVTFETWKRLHFPSIEEYKTYSKTEYGKLSKPKLPDLRYLGVGLISLEAVQDKASAQYKERYPHTVQPTAKEVEAIYKELAPEQEAAYKVVKLAHLKATKEKIDAAMPEITRLVDKAQADLDQMDGEVKRLFAKSASDAKDFSFVPLKSGFTDYLSTLACVVHDLNEPPDWDL